MAANLSRRSFLAGGLTALAPHRARSFEKGDPKFLGDFEVNNDSKDIVEHVFRTEAGSYFTYPHSNGFLNTSKFVYINFENKSQNKLRSFDLSNGSSEDISSLKNNRMYYCVSKDSIILSTKFGMIRVDRESRVEKRLNFPQGFVVSSDNDIMADGSKALLTRNAADGAFQSELTTVDTRSGEPRVILAPQFRIDHAHFCPKDPSWVFFCKNNSSREPDRLWAWHEKHAPQGRNIFNQMIDGKLLLAGHERAMFHKPAVLFIGFGSSYSTARGLYEVDFEGRSKLLSPGNRDLHCNISRDGRWAVVALMGTFSPTDERPSANYLGGDRGYGLIDTMIVNLRTGRRRFLFRTTQAPKQPYEPQPSISPNGDWVLIKDSLEQNVVMLKINQAKLNSFLAG